MLIALAIRNVILIERLDLAFAGGLTVLTGETGAGKSILLDALGLALGQRAESGLLRAGEETALVSAEFDLPPEHHARALMAEQGLDGQGPIILRRQLMSEGKSRAFVNDQPVGAGLLRQIGALLVEIEGQFEAHGLLDPASHCEHLDRFRELGPLVERCATSHRAWRAAARELAEAEARQAAAARDGDYLRHAVAELDLLKPRAGEEESLTAERTLLGNREQIREALAEAEAELAGDRGAERNLAAAERRLMRLGHKLGDEGALLLGALARASIELGEAMAALRGIFGALDGDPGKLERIEDRLFALRDLARKHRVQVGDLERLHREMAASLASLDDEGERLNELAKLAEETRARYIETAGQLGEARAKAARAFAAEVNRELPPLKLERAKVSVRFERLDEAQWGEAGWERIAIEIATNPGQAPGPIAKIASGGELSRLMLALKLVLAKNQPVATLVFDEVDADIGGATATAVGERLKRLSRGVQLLVVTHSPQVAALGDAHWRVDKNVTRTGARTSVSVLDEGARREEIARMLSGASITDEARAAAGQLLVQAR